MPSPAASISRSARSCCPTGSYVSLSVARERFGQGSGVDGERPSAPELIRGKDSRWGLVERTVFPDLRVLPADKRESKKLVACGPQPCSMARECHRHRQSLPVTRVADFGFPGVPSFFVRRYLSVSVMPTSRATSSITVLRRRRDLGAAAAPPNDRHNSFFDLGGCRTILSRLSIRSVSHHPELFRSPHGTAMGHREGEG